MGAQWCCATDFRCARFRIGAKELHMFGLFGGAPRPTWKRVEDDFVMGACSRRIFGFASRGDGHIWTAFDDQSQALGLFDRLADAQAAMWEKHQALHSRMCEPAHARFPKQRARPEARV